MYLDATKLNSSYNNSDISFKYRSDFSNKRSHGAPSIRGAIARGPREIKGAKWNSTDDPGHHSFRLVSI